MPKTKKEEKSKIIKPDRMPPPAFTILVDTREQKPFTFEDYPCGTLRMTLKTGDYSLAGCEEDVCVERKELDDIVACCMGERERFQAELERMASFKATCVVIESPLTAIRKGRYWSKINPLSVEQSILSMSYRFRVPFYFGTNRKHAELIAFNCLRHWWNHAVEPRFRIGNITHKK